MPLPGKEREDLLKVKHGALETQRKRETYYVHREAGWLINFDAFCVSPCDFGRWHVSPFRV